MARKSKSNRKSSKKSKGSSKRHSKTVEYLQNEMQNLRPELVNPYKEDYKQLYSDEKYLDTFSDFNPLMPNFNKSVFDFTRSSNPEVQQLLDINLQSRNLINSAKNVKLNVQDKFPTPLLVGKQAGGKQSGGMFKFFDNLLSPLRNHSNFNYTRISRVNPRTPQYLLDRIRDPDQMIYKANVNSEAEKNTLMAQNNLIYSNEYGFDPNKEYLLTYKDY